ncbi:hypothetical protein BG841_00245 [Marinobacter sp. X15-166B]|nr:hypothetical protein BG841_00245 [Marinobacter sp. X15-166B]
MIAQVVFEQSLRLRCCAALPDGLTFTVSIKTSESAERLQAVQAAVAPRCRVFDLLRDARVALHPQWKRV